jgi:hypothetical protein
MIMELTSDAITRLISRAMGADTTMRNADLGYDKIQGEESSLIRDTYIDAVAVVLADSSGAYRAIQSWLDDNIGGDEYTARLMADHVIHLAGHPA